MVVIRSANELVLNLIDFFRVTIPDADTKPGSVIRDLFIDAPATQLSLLYDELAKVSNLQSLRLVIGSDLDKLAQNFGATRKSSVKASGTVLFTFSSLPAIVNINKGDLITSSNGSSFAVLNGITIDPVNSNLYKSVASKYKNDLGFLNISDPYAIEVSAQATSPGTSGNISKYAIVRTTAAGISNVTNVFPFTGGSDQEDDATFRNRVLSIFSGSNIGTALGYKSVALSNPFVEDALVVEPGDPLMLRDGTVVKLNTDGSSSIVSEGSGGKIDVIILGQNLTEFTDSFIYRDQSNNNDPTDNKNIFVLGQITGDENKTINKRRIDDLKNGTLPAQPVQELTEVNGSLSGSNFVPKTIDSLGRISGNYELLKDSGSYGGSPFGFDKFKWVSDRVSLFGEDRIKSKFNGQDVLTFTDVLNISKVQQNITVTNENSKISNTNRSIIQLLHTPASNVTRVSNLTTGERYIVTNQNLDGTSSINSTGRIQITGNTLPSSSDILQVDYTWIINYDPFSDYDGKILQNNPRFIKDSIDWDMSNVIRDEKISFTLNGPNTLYSGTAKHSISSIISANVFSETSSVVVQSNVSNFTERLMIQLNALSNPIDNIYSIKLRNSNTELYNTAEDDGIVLNTRVVVGIVIKYNCTIILPTDTIAKINDKISIEYNATDVFNVVNSAGNFVTNQITVPAGNVDSMPARTILSLNYIANVQDLLSVSITSLPLSRLGNGYVFNYNAGFNNFFEDNVSRKENQTVQKNISNQFYVTLNLSSSISNININQVIAIIRLSDNKELWNSDAPGSINVDVNNNYQLILSGLNSPAIGNNVCVIYYADDLNNFQPFTFQNQIFKKDIQTLQYNSTTQKFFLPVHTFQAGTGVNFDVIDSATNNSLAVATDGVLSTSGNNICTFSSVSINFSTIDDILGKKIKISNNSFVNNNGTFDITSYDSITNTLTLTIINDNISLNQVAVIRIKDNKNLWNELCAIDLVNNILIMPGNTLAEVGDVLIVLFSNIKNLRQSSTKLISTITDQTNNSGVLTVAGTTLTKVADVVFTATNVGLKQNILEALRTSLGLISSTNISTNLSLTRVVRLQKVLTTTNNEILETLVDYDVFGTSLSDNIFYSNEMLLNNTLSQFEFLLPKTTKNLNNLPSIGDKLKITFYYSTSSDTETLNYSRNGILYTNKQFCLIDKIYTSSGLNSSQSAKLTLSTFNQPLTGTRYKAFYDYLAPKQNERIIIKYNYNNLISDVTFNIESSRPINADVLVRAAKEIFINVIINIVVKQDFSNSVAIVKQNVKDKVTAAINTGKLGDVINASNLEAIAQGTDGVDRVRIIGFNKDNQIGQVFTIVAQKDEYFAANNVIINEEAR